MLGLMLMLAVGGPDPWQARFPEDAVAVVEHETRVTVHPDGHSTTWHRRVTRPLNIEGREDYSDVRIPYFAPLQTLRVLRCAARTAEGRVVEAMPHAFNPVTPAEYGSTPDFVGFREVVVSPPAVAEGAEIILEYELADSTVLPWFEAVVPIGEEHPVLTRTIRVENCRPEMMRWSLHGIEGEAGQDSLTMWWSFTDVPAYPLAHAGPRGGMAVPRLVLSTCPEWSDVAGRFAASLAPWDQVPQEAADSLHVRLQRAATRGDTLQAVVDVAAASLRLVPAPDRRIWSCRAPERVFVTGYAEPLEAAWLIGALARHAGREGVACLVGDPLPGDSPPAAALLPESWVLVSGSPSEWLNLAGRSPLPRRDGPFAFLTLVPEGEVTQGPAPASRQGRAVLIVMPVTSDSLRLRGAIRLSAALLPAGASAGRPDDWLSSRLEQIVPRSSLSVYCNELTDTAAVYEFEGGVTIGEGITIDNSMQAWFGDGWVPPGVSVFDPPPRVQVLVPADVDLATELRIVRAHGLNVMAPEDSMTIAAGDAEVRIIATKTPASVRMIRSCRLNGGWHTRPALEEVRAVLATESRRGVSSVRIGPAGDGP